MRYLLPVVSLGFVLVNSCYATPGTTTGFPEVRKIASNIRSRGLLLKQQQQQQQHKQQSMYQDDFESESSSLYHRRLQDEDWSPAASPTYFELDEGQAFQDPNFQLPPRTDVGTTTSESAVSTQNESKNWVVPTMIFTTAIIIIIALAICIYQRRDDFDTDAESYNSDSVYEYEQGRRRRPTLNQYAEALMAIGRNNARDVPKDVPEDDDSGDVTRESGSSWGSWMNNRRRRRHERSSARRGRRPKSNDRGRANDRMADSERNRSRSRGGGGGGPDGERNRSRSRSKGPRSDIENQSDTSDTSEERSTSRSVTFLKSAMKKEKERKPTRSRSLSPSSERSLRKLPRTVPVEPDEYPSITLAPTDAVTQQAKQDAASGWCFLPSLFGWWDTNADTDIKPLPRPPPPPPPPPPPSVNHLSSREATKKKERATTYYSTRGSSRDMYSNDNDSASTGGSNRQRQTFDEVGSLAEVRARELMERLEREKQKEKKLGRKHSSRLNTKEDDRRPNDYSYRRELSSRHARSFDVPSRRNSSHDEYPRPDEFSSHRRSSSRDASRSKDYAYRRSPSKDTIPDYSSHRRSSIGDVPPGYYNQRRSSSRDAQRAKAYEESYGRDLSDGALHNDYSYRRDSSRQSVPRRSRSMEAKRTRFDDDDLYRDSFHQGRKNVEFESRDRRYDRR